MKYHLRMIRKTKVERTTPTLYELYNGSLAHEFTVTPEGRGRDRPSNQEDRQLDRPHSAERIASSPQAEGRRQASRCRAHRARHQVKPLRSETCQSDGDRAAI